MKTAKAAPMIIKCPNKSKDHLIEFDLPPSWMIIKNGDGEFIAWTLKCPCGEILAAPAPDPKICK